jgi:hypothetical protein
LCFHKKLEANCYHVAFNGSGDPQQVTLPLKDLPIPAGLYLKPTQG